LAAEITQPSQPVSNGNEQIDSIHVARSSRVKTPADMERKALATDDSKWPQGYASPKKENIRNDQQANYFNGRIKDANNNPLPFANITNTRDNVGTYADAQGRFTLVSPDSVLNVQVRSVGF